MSEAFNLQPADRTPEPPFEVLADFSIHLGNQLDVWIPETKLRKFIGSVIEERIKRGESESTLKKSGASRGFVYAPNILREAMDRYVDSTRKENVIRKKWPEYKEKMGW